MDINFLEKAEKYLNQVELNEPTEDVLDAYINGYQDGMRFRELEQRNAELEAIAYNQAIDDVIALMLKEPYQREFWSASWVPNIRKMKKLQKS